METTNPHLTPEMKYLHRISRILSERIGPLPLTWMR